MSDRLFTPRKSKNTEECYSLILSARDWAKVRIGRPWSTVVTDVKTGQRYAASGMDCGAGCFCDAVAHPVPTGRPRKYRVPELEPGRPITGDVIREIAAGATEEMRADILAMADLLDERGWIEAAGHLFVTEATLRNIEAESEKQLREHQEEDAVPGFYAEWERTVGVYEYTDRKPELQPVITIFAINPAESNEAAAERFMAVAQEHGQFVGRLS
jgi:hypothetical protein